MGTIVSWHKIGRSYLEEVHTTTDGYNCVSWKQGSLLFGHKYNYNHLKVQSTRCGWKGFSSWLGQRLSSLQPSTVRLRYVSGVGVNTLRTGGVI